MSPEHNMDQSAMTSAASPSGRCWTFDARADGYIKAEAVNCLILKRLDDAVRDGDPIRAVIRGTSTNSDGRTPGIASPSAEAQAVAIRRAYSRAGISSFGDTAYLECHGTGTLAGDPIECRAASSVFSSTRRGGAHLAIGSVKSNIGHSEPAAGISGMIKTALAVERGIIPGNPTFEIPNKNIDFDACKVMPSKAAIAWPSGHVRRASVNSFGYGGSNAHAILEHPKVLLPDYDQPGTTSYASEVEDLFAEDSADTQRSLLVFSANDETSLKSYVRELIRHLSNPAVKVDAADLAYTLSQRRTQHYYRGFVVSDGPNFKENQVAYGKFRGEARVGFVFTGQGAQWPEMGKELIAQFPVAKHTVEKLDQILQSMAEPPSWSLMTELIEPRSPEYMRLPQFSQPLVTALQLALMSVLEDFGVRPAAVVGHSSGEIGAAVAAGHLSEEDAIKVAYLRGKASEDLRASQKMKLGMLAVGLGESDTRSYMDLRPRVKIACSNSPKSVTLSGERKDLEHLLGVIQADGHFARLLQVDLAYHSDYMEEVAVRYRHLLEENCPNLSTFQVSNGVRFFSTVDGGFRQEGTDVEYWVKNMSSPVLFNRATSSMLRENGVDLMIELGPSGALAGPINQIKQSLAIDGAAPSAEYLPGFKRGVESTRPLYELAGKLFFWGIHVDPMKLSFRPAQPKPRVIIDLPNYRWNHSVKYWHESLSSKDWRYRLFPAHDLLGTKVLGTSWKEPTFRRTLRLKDVPWIRDHTIGTDILFPASGYIAMAVEAMFQRAKALAMVPFSNIENVTQASYRLRDIRLLRALVVEEHVDHKVYLFLSPAHGQKDIWFRFIISSLKDDIWSEHCSGFVRICPAIEVTTMERPTLEPLRHQSSAKLWYKSMQSVGFDFGPTFQNLVDIESLAGQRTSRARISMTGPSSQKRESTYAIHPSVFDTFFQSGMPSLYAGHRTLIDRALVPRVIDEIIVNPGAMLSDTAIATTSSVYVAGRQDKTQNYKSNATILDEQFAHVIAEVRGLHYTELDIPETVKQSKVFMTTTWNADMSLLGDYSDIQSIGLEDEDTVEFCRGLLIPPVAANLVSLLKHKVALPSFLDVDMTFGLPESSEGNREGLVSRLSLFRRYVFASSSPDHLVSAQKRLQDSDNAHFHIYDPASAGLEPLVGSEGFDLALVRMPVDASTEVSSTLKSVQGILKRSGFLILVAPGSWSDDTESSGSEATVNISRKDGDPESLLKSTGFIVKARFPSHEFIGTADFSTVFLCTVESSQTRQFAPLDFPIIDLSKSSSDECLSLICSMKDLGWTGKALEAPHAAREPSDTPLLILDNPQKPFLADVSQNDWDDIQSLIKAGRKILWVTSGSQMSVSSPSSALVHGLARCLRGEDPTLSFTTLDLSRFTHSSAAKSTLEVMAAITNCGTVDSKPSETEYCERDGVLYVSRIVPSGRLDKPDDTTNAGLEDLWLRKTPTTVRLWCERPGAMNSIHFNEVTDEPECLGDGEIEVEVYAAGVNFKVGLPRATTEHHSLIVF
jgi:acyl transferase domain-containing protein